MKALQQQLKHWFGFTQFRPGQEEMVQALLEGKNLLAMLPTGSGKSLCYQLPALMGSGLTLVVTPLISLMEDQVYQLRAQGIKAVTLLNSQLSVAERKRRERRMVEGHYRIVYLSPERLLQPQFISLCKGCQLQYLIVDEAHCISQWGHDFRPEYLGIARFLQHFPIATVAAFTATATERVRRDMKKYLFGKRAVVDVSYGVNRPNLAYDRFLCSDDDEKLARLEQLVAQLAHPGIIYVATRQEADELALHLRSQIPTLRISSYHAGLEGEERRIIQIQFMQGMLDLVIATSAFGMGINKGDIRYILHYSPPTSLEAYVQEVGRAGRDQRLAYAALLFTPADLQNNLERLGWELPSPQELERFLAWLQFQIQLQQERRSEKLRLSTSTFSALSTAKLELILRYGVLYQWWELQLEQGEWWLLLPSARFSTTDSLLTINHTLQKRFKQRHEQRLWQWQQMVSLLTEDECLRQQINRYFGDNERAYRADCCSVCGIERERYDRQVEDIHPSTTPMASWDLATYLETLLPTLKKGM